MVVLKRSGAARLGFGAPTFSVLPVPVVWAVPLVLLELYPTSAALACWAFGFGGDLSLQLSPLLAIPRFTG